MQVVIDIDEETYNMIAKQVEFRDYPDMQLGRAIVNGEVLPQDHGSLIDVDALDDELGASDYDWYVHECLMEAPIILAPSRDCMFGDYMSPIV